MFFTKRNGRRGKVLEKCANVGGEGEEAHAEARRRGGRETGNGKQ